MNGQAIVINTGSRPKVHRLPALAVKGYPAHKNRVKSILTIAIALGGGVTAMWLLTLASSTLQEPNITESMPVVSDANASMLISDKSGKTIILSDKAGTIVGQMATLPVQNNTGSDIKTVSEIDKRSGPELLSILNKY